MIAKKAELVSVGTNPGIVKTKSILIRQCKCGVRFEVHDTFQSKINCPDCTKPAKCVHGVRSTEKCPSCFKIHGNYFTRTM